MIDSSKVVSACARQLNTVFFRILPGAVLSLGISPLAVAQDVCRDSFVACVAETGSPLECQSAYLACTDTGLVTSSNPGVLTETSLQELDSHAVAQMTVTNNTADTIDVGNKSVEVICQDGRAEVAYFTFRPGLSSGGSLVSVPQRVCVGNAPARLASESPQRDAPTRRTEMQFRCPSEPDTPILMSWLGDAAVKAVKADTTYTFNLANHSTETILATVCAQKNEAESSVYLELKKLLKDYMGESPGNPDRSGTIGVRG